MTTLTIRSYAGEADLQPIADMLNECEAFDQLDEGTSVDELRFDFSEPSLDQARDLRLWEDGDGRLVGFGQMIVPEPGGAQDGFLWFRVRPEARGDDIEPQIIAWGEERMREVGRERGARTQLVANARDVDTARSALLERHGFTIVRYFLRLARPLDEPIPEPGFPAGFTLADGEHDPAAWVEMYNESFVDHWNHHPWTSETFEHYVADDPHYRPDLSLIARAPDGTYAAFCWSGVNPEENARSGRNDGWIGLLGTRRGFRKRGLGRAMLLAGMRRLKAAGADTARLGVDAESLTGATRLYESVGFRKLFSTAIYGKDL